MLRRLLGLKRKKTGHELTTEDRVKGQQIRSMDSDLRRMDALIHMKQLEYELQIAETELQELRGPENDGIEGQFTQVLTQFLAQRGTPQVKEEPQTEITVEEILKLIPEKYRNKLRKMTLPSRRAIIRQYAPTLPDQTVKQLSELLTDAP